MNRILAIAAVGLSLAVGGSAHAALKPEVRFIKGTTSTTLKGAVVRGDNDVWRVAGKAGQTIKVDIVAPENNAVFQVYAPGARMGHDEVGWSFAGKTLPGAAEGQDARHIVAKLPTNGMYLIVVGGTRGNAAYTLAISIR